MLFRSDQPFACAFGPLPMLPSLHRSLRRASPCGARRTHAWRAIVPSVHSSSTVMSPECRSATAFARSSGATTRWGHGVCIARAAGAIAKRRAFATRASVPMPTPASIMSHYPAARATLNGLALQRSPAARPNPAVNRTRRHVASHSRTSARRAGYLRRWASASRWRTNRRILSA